MFLITEETRSNTFSLKDATGFLSKLFLASHELGIFYSTTFHSKWLLLNLRTVNKKLQV